MDALDLLWTEDGKVNLAAMYTHDLHHRMNNFTVPFAAWTRLTVATDAVVDKKAKSLGLFLMQEPVDAAFMRKRFPADKRGALIFYDEKKIDEHTKNLSNLNHDLFLRILAVNEMVNNQDDYRSAQRNFAVYLDDRKKVHWISYGFAKTTVPLATPQSNATAMTATRPLLEEVISQKASTSQYERYKQQIADPKRHLLDAKKSAPRLAFWKRLAGDALTHQNKEK
jgi:hypothetical protein